MDLRTYYKSIHDMEAKLPTEEVAVVSKATPDGGLEGIVSEMPRAAAAKSTGHRNRIAPYTAWPYPTSASGSYSRGTPGRHRRGA